MITGVENSNETSAYDLKESDYLSIPSPFPNSPPYSPISSVGVSVIFWFYIYIYIFCSYRWIKVYLVLTFSWFNENVQCNDNGSASLTRWSGF